MPTEPLVLLMQVYYACDIVHITNMRQCKNLFHWDKGIFTLLHTHVGKRNEKRKKVNTTFELILAPSHGSLTKTASGILAESYQQLSEAGTSVPRRTEETLQHQCPTQQGIFLLPPYYITGTYVPITDKWAKLTVLTLGAWFVRKHPFNLRG